MRFDEFTSLDPSNRFRIVESADREVLDDVIFPTGSYSSFGVDLNPLDFAYRADSPQDAVLDLTFLAIDLLLIPISGGAGRLARVTWQFFKEVY